MTPNWNYTWTSWSLILHILHIWSMKMIKKALELQMHKSDRHPSPKESYWYMYGGYSHWQFMLHTNCCHFYRKSFKINSPLASIYLVNIFPSMQSLQTTWSSRRLVSVSRTFLTVVQLKLQLWQHTNSQSLANKLSSSFLYKCFGMF